MNFKKLFVVLILLTLITILSLQIIGRHLINPESPAGIVSFEYSGNLNKAEHIVDAWGEEGRIYAALDLGIDYLFVLLYTATLVVGSMLFTPKGHRILHSASRIMVIASIIAGLLDCIENFALFKILTGSRNENLAYMAKLCATPKFLLAGSVLIFIISTWVYSKISSVKTKDIMNNMNG